MGKKRAHSLKHPKWISLDVYPVSICYAPTLEVWEKQLVKLKCPEPQPPRNAHQKGGFVRLFQNDETGHHVIMVYIADRTDPFAVLSTIVHESVHVWQFITQVINEDHPGMEPEAYAIGVIYEKIVDAYANTVGHKRKWIIT